MPIRHLKSSAPEFQQQLDKLLGIDKPMDATVVETVQGILEDVRRRGDQALIEYTNHFDRRAIKTASELELPRERLNKALAGLDPDLYEALRHAAERIQGYHERQKQVSWTYVEEDGTVLGQQIIPLDRIGVYVPGGKAAYPSTVLMTVIPARVAGVEEILMVAPAPQGELAPVVLAAAAIAGVDRVFTIGGAQAIAVLAYGTETIPAVDKIVGPGNIYVATAKAMVFGRVGIDMIAGPSEIVIICDGQTDPDWIAMDLFSQAEHDEQARAIVLSPEAAFLEAVEASIARQLPQMERAPIIRTSLSSQGALIAVRDLDEAAEIVNQIAPEHLELAVADPQALAAKIRHAGAIFMGSYTAEVLGDYCAGPNHVLPTARTARFSSPLGVYDFQKRSSLIQCSERAAQKLGQTASVLARAEGLTAHARSAEYRF
ncbi:MAG TPA: histidinol dehydrogenase [Gammaproteobacteria bacterium]|nr:histidinol dehydrogenase [Gammaproteobacteria bacterium]